MKIKQGQIWQVITHEFKCNDVHRKLKTIDDPPPRMAFDARKLILQKDEYIEIRYPFAWHFRTRDNLYFQATEDEIKNNCKYVGQILENIKWRNKNELDGILREKLYEDE